MILLEEKETKEDVAKDSSEVRGVDITKVRDHIIIILDAIEMDMRLSISKFHGKRSQKDKNRNKIKVKHLNPLIILSPIAILE
jgi:hypothetical protein